MTIAGKVESLWRYPVKSMRGEEIPQAFIGFAGVYGDRLYAIRSTASIKGFPYLTGRENASMLQYRAIYMNPEAMAQPVNLIEASDLGSGVTPLYADEVNRLVQVETADGLIYPISDPDLLDRLYAGIDPKHKLSLIRSERALTDCRPVSLISLQTVQGLGSEIGLPLDKRRFRANIYLDLYPASPFGENGLLGRMVRIGSKVEVAVTQRDTRCKMITLDPDTGEATPEIMKHLANAHGSQAGVYGSVVVEGIVKAGDEVILIDDCHNDRNVSLPRY